jgi:hypothetical protein
VIDLKQAFTFIRRGQVNMKKIISIPIYLTIFMAISVYLYSNFIQTFKQPPSDVWSKEVLIGKISDNTELYPRIMNVGENVLVAYQDGGSIKLIMTDKLGQVIKNADFTTDDKIVKCLNMLQDKNNIYLNWITGSFEGRHINILKLNKNLDKISEEKMFGVDSSEQISQNILLLGYKDRIEVIDMNTSINTSVPAEKPSLIAGTLTDKGYLITYYENKADFKCFFVKDDKVSETKIIGRYIMVSKSSFGKIAVSSDNKYGYSLLK